MKVVLVALALVAVTSAASIEGTPLVAILRSLYDLKLEGSYRYGYENSNGIKREGSGEFEMVTNEKNKPFMVRGRNTYTDNEGKTEVAIYEADEKGFRAFGPSIGHVNSEQFPTPELGPMLGLISGIPELVGFDTIK